MGIAGMSAAGYDTVGDIVATHLWKYHHRTDAAIIVTDMLTHHVSVVPVVDAEGGLAGFIGEREVLEALRKGREIGLLTAEDLMSEDTTSVIHENTSLQAVLKLFQDKDLHIIPVVRENQVIKSITRHDLIRALSGAGLGVEKQP